MNDQNSPMPPFAAPASQPDADDAALPPFVFYSQKPKLEGIKPGGKLKVPHDYGGGFDIHTVERVTKTQAACGGRSFKLDTGLLIGSGGGWRSRYASLCTDADLEQAKLAARVKHAQERLNRFKVTVENLEAVEAIFVTKVA